MSFTSNHKRWTVIAGALIVQVILGTVYAFSVFVRPLETEFGWGRTTTQWAFSAALATFALMMIPAGKLQDRIGPRKVATIGGVLLGLSFLLGALLVTEDRPWALYLTYGIIGGAGIGMAYVCPILVLPPAESGDAIGISQILLVGLGISEGSGFGIGWKSFFILHGVVCLIAVTLGAMLLRNPPAGYQPEGWSPVKANEKPGKDIDWPEMLNTPLCCMLWLTFIFGATSGLMAIGQWKPLMSGILQGQSFAPEWMGTFGRFVEPVGVLAIFNALGRIFWGKVSDLIDRPRAMMMMYLAQGMAFMILVSAKTPLTIFLASAWVGLNFGGNFALFPSATSDYFGSKHFGINYGWIFTAYGVAGILGPVVGGVLFDATQDYIIAFVFAGTLCFLAGGSAVVVWGLARARKLENGDSLINEATNLSVDPPIPVPARQV
jgi:OFA family oxalate/formate antiporter-like MFS transporter